MDGNATVSICSFRTEPEALSAAARLEAEGIPCRVVRIDPSGVSPIVGFAQGVQLLVSPEYEQRAHELLEAVESGLLGASLAPGDSDKTADSEGMDSADTAQIRAGLERIRRRRRLVWIVFFAYIPVVLIVTRFKPERPYMERCFGWHCML